MDLTIPTATSAKQISPNQVEVFFSEPVQVTTASADFQIDNGQYAVTNAVVNPLRNSVTLTTGVLSEGTHKVTVNPTATSNVRDFANLKVAKTDVNFDVVKDTTAPALTSAKAESQDEVVLTFSKPLKQAPTPSNIYHTSNTNAFQGTGTATEVVGSNKTQWKVKFANPLPTGSLNIYVAKEAAEDSFGNKNKDVLQATANVEADTTKPTVTTFKSVSNSKAELTFSEDVTGADVKANYKVTDKDGKDVAFTVNYSSTDKKATINFAPALKEGETYNVTVSGVKDKAVNPNEMDKYTTSFTTKDVTAPTVNTPGLYNATDKKITVFFSEAIDGTSALDKSKYTLVVNGTNEEIALPSDATISLGSGNSSITIQLPNTVKNAAGDTITDFSKVIVGQVKDLAGNVSKTFTEVTLNTSAAALGAADVVTKKAVDTRTVVLELNTALKSIDATDFTVNGNNLESATYENKTLSNGSYGSVITLKVATADAWATNATPEVKTKNQPLLTKTVYDGKFTQNLTIGNAADKVAPQVGKKDDGKANVFVTGVNASNAVNEITVTFTEAIKTGSVSINSFEVPGQTIADIDTSAAGKVKIKLTAGSVANVTDTFSVKIVGDVQDVAGNVLKADASVSYNVTPVVAVGLSLPTGKAVQVGEGDITLVQNPAAAATTKSFTSSDPGKATVDNTGKITPVAAGTTTIKYVGTDTDGNIVEAGSITVTVHAVAEVGAVPTIPAPTTTTGTGAVATGHTAPQAGETITWTVTNGTGSATINSTTGAVTGVTAGDVTVAYKVVETATGKVVAKSAPVTVTIP